MCTFQTTIYLILEHSCECFDCKKKHKTQQDEEIKRESPPKALLTSEVNTTEHKGLARNSLSHEENSVIFFGGASTEHGVAPQLRCTTSCAPTTAPANNRMSDLSALISRRNFPFSNPHLFRTAKKIADVRETSTGFFVGCFVFAEKSLSFLRMMDVEESLGSPRLGVHARCYQL